MTHNQTQPSVLTHGYDPTVYAPHTIVMLSRRYTVDGVEMVLCFRSDTNLFHDEKVSALHAEAQAAFMVQAQTAADGPQGHPVYVDVDNDIKVNYGPDFASSSPSSVKEVFVPKYHFAPLALKLYYDCLSCQFLSAFVKKAVPWMIASFLSGLFPENFEDCLSSTGALKFHFPVQYIEKRFKPGKMPRWQVHRLLLIFQDCIARSVCGEGAWDQVSLLYYPGDDPKNRTVRLPDGSVPFPDHTRTFQYSIKWHNS